MPGHICIGEECIACGACVPECPENAIYMDDDSACVIPELCIGGVGACSLPCWEVCPLDAISGICYTGGMPTSGQIASASEMYGCSLCGGAEPPIS